MKYKRGESFEKISRVQADEKRGLSFNELPFDIFYRFLYLPWKYSSRSQTVKW